MDNLEQKKLDVISKILKPLTLEDDDYIFAKDILDALKQFDHEPLEVEICKDYYGCVVKYITISTGVFKRVDLFWSKEEKDALAFCKKKGLKVIGCDSKS